MESSETLAHFAKEQNIHFTFVSTNYVFDGNKEASSKSEISENSKIISVLKNSLKGSAYEVTDPTSPINDYGAQKAEAEQRIMNANENAAIVRISLQYGRFGTHTPSSKGILDCIRGDKPCEIMVQ